MQKPVYFDYAATTPVDPQVARVMAECLVGNYGNPASRSHLLGWKAEEAVENARAQVAELVAADSREIVWTSGATESDNLAIKGVVEARGFSQSHIITSSIEHKAVLDTCQYLETLGTRVTYLQPASVSDDAGESAGLISTEAVIEAITPDTVLVSLMMVNNEIGVVNDVASIGKKLAEINCERAPDKKILLHVDAAQAAGKLPINVNEQHIDLMSLSAHKMYGPKGIGALYVRRSPDVKVLSQIHGGGHERGMRSGTLPTHQIVGFGEAAAIAKEKMHDENARILALRNRFLKGVQGIEALQVNGALENRVAGNLNISVAGVDGETLLMSLRDFALSTGSACTSASVEPSYVLKAIGVNDELAHASLRFSFGRFTTEEEIDFAIEKLTSVVDTLRKNSTQWLNYRNAHSSH